MSIQPEHLKKGKTEISKECRALLASDQAVTNDTLKEILTSAKVACRDYENKTLSADDWVTQMERLEEKSAFLTIPDGLSGILPFRGNALPDKYATYSFFLFPSTEWKAKKDDVGKLRQEFLDFGDAIGSQRLAVWFADREGNLDINRSKFYCDISILITTRGRTC